MNKKRIYILILFFVLITLKIYGQPEDPYGGDGPPDPGGDLPIPGVLYFLVALLGIGIKKIRDNYKNRD